MNRILAFLRIPLVKFIAIMVILYFALFSNKQNPNSLGNRFSKDEINKHLSEASEKSRFIISNVKTAQELAESKRKQPMVDAIITIEDLESGKEGDAISCGSEVEVTYGIYGSDGKMIKSVSSEKIVIGGNTNPIIEKNVMSLKPGSIRNINIPRNFKTDDQNLKEMLGFYSSDLRYQLTILSVKTIPGNQMTCS